MQTIVIFTFNMLLLNGTLFFRSQRTPTHLLMSFNCIGIMGGYILKYYQKSIFGATGDDWLIFPASLLLHSLSICYCFMENHFSEDKKTTNSFTYELQHFLVKMTNVNQYRKYATSPIATCLSTDAGMLVTMMEVDCQLSTALGRDSPASIPSYIALAEPTPSGRAQVHAKICPLHQMALILQRSSPWLMSTLQQMSRT